MDNPRGNGQVVHDRSTPRDSSTSLGSKAKRTRAQLISSARHVFESAGVNEARVADIAAGAKVSYGSFYTYFASKEEIFREVVREVTGEMFTATVAPGPEGANPVERIREANRRYLRSYARNARIMGLIEEVAPYDEYCRELLVGIRAMFNQRNEAGIRRLQDRGLVDRNLDPHVAAIALGGMVEHFGSISFLLGEPYEETVAVETLTRLWAQAIGLTAPTDPPQPQQV